MAQSLYSGLQLFWSKGLVLEVYYCDDYFMFKNPDPCEPLPKTKYVTILLIRETIDFMEMENIGTGGSIDLI